jgi:hypothetical protein
LTEGEKEATTLNYAPLPASMAAAVTSRLDSIKFGAAR